MQQYVEAIETMVHKNDTIDVHILLWCTEDPVTVDAFRNVTNGTGWTILVDASYHKLPYRRDLMIRKHLPSFIAKETKGESGLWALGSLLASGNGSQLFCSYNHIQLESPHE